MIRYNVQPQGILTVVGEIGVLAAKTLQSVPWSIIPAVAGKQIHLLSFTIRPIYIGKGIWNFWYVGDAALINANGIKGAYISIDNLQIDSGHAVYAQCNNAIIAENCAQTTEIVVTTDADDPAANYFPIKYRASYVLIDALVI